MIEAMRALAPNLFALAAVVYAVVLLDLGRRHIASRDRRRDWEHERLHAVERETREKLELFEKAIGRTASDLGARVTELEDTMKANRIARQLGRKGFHLPETE